MLLTSCCLLSIILYLSLLFFNLSFSLTYLISDFCLSFILSCVCPYYSPCRYSSVLLTLLFYSTYLVSYFIIYILLPNIFRPAAALPSIPRTPETRTIPPTDDGVVVRPRSPPDGPPPRHPVRCRLGARSHESNGDSDGGSIPFSFPPNVLHRHRPRLVAIEPDLLHIDTPLLHHDLSIQDKV